MEAASHQEGRSYATKVLLRISASIFLLFWVGVIIGKLRIGYRLDLPTIPEIALLALLELSLALALGACLLEEQRQTRTHSKKHITTSETSNG